MSSDEPLDPVQPSSIETDIRRYEDDVRDCRDTVAVEEPLEIRLVLDGRELPLSVTMRTPGDDEHLAAGFLFTEGIVDRRDQITDISLCAPNQSGFRNLVKVSLSTDVEIDEQKLSRHVYTTSSCGVCGKTSIDAVHVANIHPLPTDDESHVSRALVDRLPALLRASQEAFSATGGVHAAALFDLDGNLRDIREDVGRHNAVDKLIGAALRRDEIPLSRSIIMVSGRAGFELVQKSVRAGIPIMAAVSAPTSLAIELARNNEMTLLAFVREGRFNCYSAPERVRGTMSDEG